MNRITFSQDDVKDPIKLERVLQQFRSAVETPIIAAPTKFSPQSINTQALAEQIAKLVQPELQATGKAPLNITNLLPGGSSGGGLPLQGPHSSRLATNPAAEKLGQLFFETDRHALYIISNVGGSLVWVFVAGVDSNTHANVPTDLGANDAGFIFEVLDYSHTAVWDGGAWRLTDGGGGYIVDAVTALATGWQLCDGSATDFILNNTTNLALQPFTTPNEVAAPGTFHASIAGYTGVINPAHAPGLSGSVSSNPAGVTLNKVTDNVPNVGPDTVLDTATSITDPGHIHGVGTLTVDNTGVPTNLGVLRYFRR